MPIKKQKKQNPFFLLKNKVYIVYNFSDYIIVNKSSYL